MLGLARKQFARILAIGWLIALCGYQQVDAQFVTVSMVIDGDRVVLSDGRKISLVGVDAPEKHLSAKLSRDALHMGRHDEAVILQGNLAAEYLNHMVGGKPVFLTEIGKKDPEGYIPAIVYLADTVGRPQYCINERLIEKGYAVTDYAINFATLAHYGLLEENARRAKRGLWARGLIFVKPQEVKSYNLGAIDATSSCTRDTACVWVSAGDGVQSGVGMWQSRAGRKCACAVN